MSEIRDINLWESGKRKIDWGKTKHVYFTQY